jgi:hypothetical protein
LNGTNNIRFIRRALFIFILVYLRPWVGAKSPNKLRVAAPLVQNCSYLLKRKGFLRTWVLIVATPPPGRLPSPLFLRLRLDFCRNKLRVLRGTQFGGEEETLRETLKSREFSLLRYWSGASGRGERAGLRTTKATDRRPGA